MSYIYSQAVNIQKIDGVWDCHFQDSLRSETRNEVQESTQTFSLIEKLLTARQYFCCSDNKSKLLRLLSTQLLS